MLEKPPLDVVVAVILRQGTVLIAQRLTGDSFGGYWEFPGGKLRPGEEMDEALRREILEELGVRIEVISKRMVVEYRYSQRTIRLHCFDCRLLEGEPQKIECADWRWVRPEELGAFRFPPASDSIIETLKSISKGIGE